jgi:hypothetical protein
MRNLVNQIFVLKVNGADFHIIARYSVAILLIQKVGSFDHFEQYSRVYD